MFGTSRYINLFEEEITLLLDNNNQTVAECDGEQIAAKANTGKKCGK